MKKSASELRKTAREGLKGNWLIAVLAGILASILGAGTGFNFNFRFGSDSGVNSGGTENLTQNQQQMLEELETSMEQVPTEVWIALATFFSIFLGTALIVGLIRYVVGSATILGYNKFNLDIIDNIGVEGKNAEIGTMFGGFKIFFKAFGLQLFKDLFTFLWTLLFFIPGIIAGYRYSMATYIMGENHEIGIRDAVKLSKKMMHGYKWRLFCLNLSFIGWILLSFLACFIPLLWVGPYMSAANAAFYRMVAENYAAEQN